MKLASWNVNGLRACIRKGFLNWLEKQALDVVCLQETKVELEQIPEILKEHPKYSLTLFPAHKKGYSGVLTLVKKGIKVKHHLGIGIEKFDSEGRLIISEFENFVLFNAYYPNGQRDHKRVDFKLEFSEAVLQKALSFEKMGKNIILCGDFNTAYSEIDLANPKTNQKTTGFLPQERAWLDRLMSFGYTDTYRLFYPEKKGAYTWWTYRNQCRERNIGWRIDYFFVNKEMKNRVKKAFIQEDVLGSDHCPLGVQIDLTPPFQWG